jgi:hypothetical protein
LAKWSVICTPKDQGGFGIQDLEVKNMTLLDKWIFKLLTDMTYDKPFLKGNMSAQRHYHRFFGNPVIHIFGLLGFGANNKSAYETPNCPRSIEE